MIYKLKKAIQAQKKERNEVEIILKGKDGFKTISMMKEIIMSKLLDLMDVLKNNNNVNEKVNNTRESSEESFLDTYKMLTKISPIIKYNLFEIIEPNIFLNINEYKTSLKKLHIELDLIDMESLVEESITHFL